MAAAEGGGPTPPSGSAPTRDGGRFKSLPGSQHRRRKKAAPRGGFLFGRDSEPRQAWGPGGGGAPPDRGLPPRGQGVTGPRGARPRGAVEPLWGERACERRRAVQVPPRGQQRTSSKPPRAGAALCVVRGQEGIGLFDPGPTIGRMCPQNVQAAPGAVFPVEQDAPQALERSYPRSAGPAERRRHRAQAFFSRGMR